MSKRVIGSKEYAIEIEDVICDALEDAVVSAWREIAGKYGIADAEKNEDNVRYGFADGIMPTVRDSVIETFEFWGLDVEPDGKDW